MHAKTSWVNLLCYRSSRSKVFCEKGVLKYFVKFTGKHLCQSLFLFFNKVADLSYVRKKKSKIVWQLTISAKSSVDVRLGSKCASESFPETWDGLSVVCYCYYSSLYIYLLYIYQL